MGDLFSTRVLREQDRDEILSLCSARKKISRVEKSSAFTQAFIDNLDKYLNPQDTIYQLNGAFSADGRLASFLGQVYWDREPVWFSSLALTRPGQCLQFDAAKNGAAAVMGFSLNEGKRRKRYRAYILRNREWPFAHYFKSLQESIPEYNHYDRYVEFTIPAGAKPDYFWAWAMMGERIWPADLYVEQLVLKQEFRPPELQIGIT